MKSLDFFKPKNVVLKKKKKKETSKEKENKLISIIFKLFLLNICITSLMEVPISTIPSKLLLP